MVESPTDVYDAHRRIRGEQNVTVIADWNVRWGRCRHIMELKLLFHVRAQNRFVSAGRYGGRPITISHGYELHVKTLFGDWRKVFVVTICLHFIIYTIES